MAGKGAWGRAVSAAALAALALLAPAASVRAQGALPDLVADPPGDGVLQVYSIGSSARLLLRFDAWVHNQGRGALTIRGSNRAGNVMTSVEQIVAGSALPSGASVIYEPEDGHDHWHLKHAARYSLWNTFRTAEVAPGMKVGFCLQDSEPVDGHAPRRPTYTDQAISFCQSGSPQTSTVLMGISPGWRDFYDLGLAFQWVDVSSVSPGIYWLRSEVDPDGVVRESNEANAASFGAHASVVPGHVAQPLTVALTPGRPAAIALQAERYGAAGPVQFRIDAAPRCGELDRPLGAWLTAPQ
ncbi:MAG TPA: lysyl oxidase family protein, partial [Thermoleophilaceae bacterium]|nr:lysyl oxidase family protein [Thermoleophilaceae bacterium]